MNHEIFIDTSGFFSLLSTRDSSHNEAVQVLKKAQQSRQLFITTDYIIDETVTLLKARGIRHIVRIFFETVISSSVCRIEWMDQERFEETKSYFEKHLDQEWSFTDCFSFFLMKEKKIRYALTKDRHFRSAGFIPLLSE